MSTKTIYSTVATRFDLSAAALHILAMALMLMDHLWATLLPAQVSHSMTWSLTKFSEAINSMPCI